MLGETPPRRDAEAGAGAAQPRAAQGGRDFGSGGGQKGPTGGHRGPPVPALTAGRALGTPKLSPATCTGKGELKTVTDTRLVEQSPKIPNGFKQTQPHVYYFCSTSLFKPKHMILRQLTQGF